MEEKQLSIADTSKNDKNQYLIQNLYRKTYNTLESYDPINDQTITSLLKIIKTTNKLQDKGPLKRITEKDLMTYCSQQDISLIDKHLFQNRAPYNSPYHVSIFFERLRLYNEQIKKKNLQTPTLEQFNTQLNNHRITTCINYANTIGITLNKNVLQHEIPNNVAIHDFTTLISAITKILFLTPEAADYLVKQININNNQDQKQDNS
jgi:hypothetical protein